MFLQKPGAGRGRCAGFAGAFNRLSSSRPEQKAIDAALAAVGLIHRLPMAHLNLGIALSRGREFERAKTAFENAVQFSPDMIRAHRWLAIIHRNLKNHDKAVEHRQRVQEIRNKRPQPIQLESKREQRVELPVFATEKERLEILKRERPEQKNLRRKSGRTLVLVSGLPRSELR